MKPDYYQLLDLRSHATAAEIKKSFRELAKKFHPDRNPGNPDAEERFKLINEAYDQLRDPERRADYDRYLNRLQSKKAPQQAAAWYDDFHPVDHELSDFFKGFYSSRSASSRRRATRGADVRLNVKVAFHEAALGCVKEIRFPISVDCPRCGGSGIPAGAQAASLYALSWHREKPVQCGTSEASVIALPGFRPGVHGPLPSLQRQRQG